MLSWNRIMLSVCHFCGTSSPPSLGSYLIPLPVFNWIIKATTCPDLHPSLILMWAKYGWFTSAGTVHKGCCFWLRIGKTSRCSLFIHKTGALPRSHLYRSAKLKYWSWLLACFNRQDITSREKVQQHFNYFEKSGLRYLCVCQNHCKALIDLLMVTTRQKSIINKRTPICPATAAARPDILS